MFDTNNKSAGHIPLKIYIKCSSHLQVIHCVHLLTNLFFMEKIYPIYDFLSRLSDFLTKVFILEE